MLGMIAGGSGLTAMLQTIRRLLLDSEDVMFPLLISDRSPVDIFYEKELNRLTRQYPNRLSIFRTLSREIPSGKFFLVPLNTWL